MYSPNRSIRIHSRGEVIDSYWTNSHPLLVGQYLGQYSDRCIMIKQGGWLVVEDFLFPITSTFIYVLIMSLFVY